MIVTVLLDGQEFLLISIREKRHKCNIFITYIEKPHRYKVLNSL